LLRIVRAKLTYTVNLGKWILRYLFSNLIDEEIKRDEAFRAQIMNEKKEETRPDRPTNITIPRMNVNGWKDAAAEPTSGSTIRGNGFFLPHTPGMGIGLATPNGPPSSAGRGGQSNAYLTPTTEEGSQLEPTKSQRSSTQDGQDYFGQGASTNGNGNGNGNSNGNGNGNSNGNGKAVPAEGSDSKEEAVQSPTETDTPSKKGKGMFGKKFNMGFSMKKFGTGTAIAAEPVKPVVDDKSEDSDSRSTKTEEKKFEDNFLGTIQRIRHGYEEGLAAGASELVSQIAPSLPNDTPVLKPPAMTTILIQEDRPGSGGVADLFEGKVGTLGQQADLIEKAAPQWLGEVLLRVGVICIVL
jgi:WD repeat-containing protein 48